jgi:hypothetical protein
MRKVILAAAEEKRGQIDEGIEKDCLQWAQLASTKKAKRTDSGKTIGRPQAGLAAFS